MILAIESSGPVGGAALVEGDAVIAERLVDAPRGRGTALVGLVSELLAMAPGLERVVVGIGPGSYNGIRGALALGWGIAAARDIPLIGLSSLLGFSEERYAAAGDARRGQYYWARVENGLFIEEPAIFEKADFERKVAEAARLPIFLPSPIEGVDGTVQAASAAILARRGAMADPAPGVPEPLYLKPAFINLPGKTGV
ncbi:tRNA (adenosine(37)-N6)-threonylcarbamoyltransferase complex dimerization subunit type 1 TsaB [Spartobacteria bacterium LR76]|nr:tRNA (adenosine(37)-N6)-threonylcarbamoyltransferase complex dimerization subunit type 1 TsaB [Spartobacteria bacterium LR76]